MKQFFIISFLFILITNLYSSGWFTLQAATTRGLHSAYFINSNTGFIAADEGAVYKTTDGGNSWVFKITGTNEYLYTIFFIKNSNPLTGFAAGTRGSIIKTINGGENWSILNSNLDSNILCIFFTNPNTGYASEIAGRIIKTTNG